MDISPPILRNVSVLCGTFPTLTEMTKELWEISVLRPDDVVWCVVLSYLKSFPSTNSQEFSTHLNKLGNTKVSANIKSRIKHYNPFLSRNAGLYDELVNELIRPFREKINTFISERETTHQNFIDSNTKELIASATLLSYDIVVISYEGDMSNSAVTFFPAVHDPMGFRFNFNKCIFLFSTIEDGRNKFSTSLEKDQGLAMQKTALKEILRRHIKHLKLLNFKIIKRICLLPDISDNFLIALIKEGYEYIIPSLLKSAYISKKLWFAGFRIDPRTNDKTGRNALFYALLLKNSYLLYFLYDFAANACFRTENSIRSPDSLIVENLILMTEYVTNLKKVVKFFCVNNTDNFFARIDELLQFNKFQIDICQRMNKINQNIDYYDSPELYHEANQRKNIILSILKMYEKYFHYQDSTIQTRDDFSYFKGSLNHCDYYDNLDFCCTVLFFDNLFLLKERLRIENNLYRKIESMFFLNLFCRRRNFRLLYDPPAHRMIIFQNRKDLLNEIRHFLESLEKTNICEENLLRCVPDDEVDTLTNLPEMYDEFFIYRIQMYLCIAIDTIVKDRKSILVIERALQVIGESVTDRLEILSLQNVIAFGLPTELVTDLKRIRNQLSHLKPEHFSWRLSAENNIELFESVKFELKVLYNVLQPVFSVHNSRLQRYILLLALKSFNKAAKGNVRDECISYAKDSSLSSDDKNDVNDGTESLNFHYQWKDFFNSAFQHVEREITEPNVILTRSSTKRYKYILKNMFLSVQKKMNEIQSKVSDIDNCKKLLNECLLPIECILDCISTDKSIKSFHQELLNKFEERRSFLEINKEVNSKINSGKDLVLTSAENQEQREDKNKTEIIEISDRSTTVHEESHDLKVSDVFEKVEAIFSDYKNTCETIFQNVCHKVNEDLAPSFPNIHKLRKIIMGKAYLSEKDKKQIRRDITDSNKAVKKLKNTVFEKKLSSEELNIEFSKLRFKEKEWKELSEDYETDPTNFLARIEIVSDILVELESVMELNEMDKKQYDKFCDKLDLSEESKAILIRIVKGYKEKNPGDQLEFLSNRIKLLKFVLIEENKDIAMLWDKVRNQKSKDHTHLRESLTRLYLNDLEVRLSSETLLFDCMNVLKNENLLNLLRKSSSLFNGIDLRNVLAHGNPLFEILSKLLFPDDLPSALVNKMLCLILDHEIIDIMLKIRSEAQADYAKFMTIMNDEIGTYKDLCEQIRNSENWKDYAKLIPLNR